MNKQNARHIVLWAKGKYEGHALHEILHKLGHNMVTSYRKNFIIEKLMLTYFVMGKEGRLPKIIAGVPADPSRVDQYHDTLLEKLTEGLKGIEFEEDELGNPTLFLSDEMRMAIKKSKVKWENVQHRLDKAKELRDSQYTASLKNYIPEIWKEVARHCGFCEYVGEGNIEFYYDKLHQMRFPECICPVVGECRDIIYHTNSRHDDYDVDETIERLEKIVDIAFRAIEKVETSRPKSITGLNKGDW